MISFKLFLSIVRGGPVAWRQYQLSKSRPKEEFGAFEHCVAQKGLDYNISIAAFRYFQQNADFPFSISLNDDVSRTFGMIDEDLDDAIKEIAEMSGRFSPKNVEAYPIVVASVEDVIRLISRFPRHSGGEPEPPSETKHDS